MRGKQAYRTSGTWVDRPEAPFGPLGWEDNGDSYSALLPFIPGYPVGYNTVAVMPASESGDDKLEYDTGWWFMMFIHTNNDGDVLPVSPVDMGIYDTFPTAEDTMQFIEDHLSPESVSQVLEDMDFMPVRDDNGYWLRASRHATRRAASLDLDWERDEEYCRADLPAIPGYSGGAIATLTLKDTDDIENPWDIDIIYYPADSAQDPVTVDCWSIHGFNPDTVSYWSLMNAVDELDINAIGDALNNLGVEPDED